MVMVMKNSPSSVIGLGWTPCRFAPTQTVSRDHHAISSHLVGDLLPSLRISILLKLIDLRVANLPRAKIDRARKTINVLPAKSSGDRNFTQNPILASGVIVGTDSVEIDVLCAEAGDCLLPYVVLADIDGLSRCESRTAAAVTAVVPATVATVVPRTRSRLAAIELPVALPVCRSLRHGSRAPILRGAILTKLTAAIAPEHVEGVGFRAALAVLDPDQRSSVVTRTANQGL